ncbi:MAG: ATP-binding protein [Candidatus Shapirobacteria bacterium]
MINILDLFKKKKVETTPVQPTPSATEGEAGTKPFVEGLVSIKDIIAPSALEVDFDHIRIDNKYYRTCFVAGYPRFVGLNWLSGLINFDASQRVAMYIYPTDGKEILDDLRRKIAEMEAEISTDIQRGKVVNPSTQAKLEDALTLQADLVKGEERFFQFGLYVTVEAATREELNKTTKNLEAALGSIMIISKKATLQMEEGFVTTLPLCDDKLAISRNMDTTSLATTFPFVSSDLSDDKGVMFGINEHNGSLVIFDRFSMQNYNSVVFASAGAGKSYMIKLEVMRSLMFGTEIIVIDPENEYKVLAESVGGQYIAFGFGENSKINPFDLSLTVEEGENALNDKILTLHKMFKIMLGAMDPMEESVLDRAVMEAYKAKGITPDPETQTREPPLVEDLYKALIGMENERAQNLAARMEKYIKGSFAGIFNQKTTVNLKNKFVVFGIRNLEESLRPVAMHIVLDYIWTVVKKELKKRILVVDEAWYLMQFEDSASFLRGIVKRGRKYYLGVTTITQDVDDFLETPYGKEIVTNSSIQILLKQHSAAIDLIGNTFYLSEGEKQLLLTADKGEGIFFAGQNHVAIKVIASEEEHKLITSNPEDVMKNKAAFELNLENKKNEVKNILPPIIEEEPNQNPSVPVEPEHLPLTGAVKIEAKEEIKVAEPIVKTEIVLNPSPTLPLTLLNGGQAGQGVEQKEEIKLEENKPSSFRPVVEVEESDIEIDLKKRIALMEEEEKLQIEAHSKKVEIEKAEAEKVAAEEKKLSGTFSNFGGLPKYQELFKAPKLPPLPTAPIFPSQNEEVKIPQPAQLMKKKEEIKVEEKKPEDKKMDYDKLFGN